MKITCVSGNHLGGLAYEELFDELKNFIPGTFAKHLSKSLRSRLLRNVLVLGDPNAGKSAFLNTLNTTWKGADVRTRGYRESTRETAGTLEVPSEPLVLECGLTLRFYDAPGFEMKKTNPESMKLIYDLYRGYSKPGNCRPFGQERPPFCLPEDKSYDHADLILLVANAEIPDAVADICCMWDKLYSLHMDALVLLTHVPHDKETHALSIPHCSIDSVNRAQPLFLDKSQKTQALRVIANVLLCIENKELTLPNRIWYKKVDDLAVRPVRDWGKTHLDFINPTILIVAALVAVVIALLVLR